MADHRNNFVVDNFFPGADLFYLEVYRHRVADKYFVFYEHHFLIASWFIFFPKDFHTV